MFSNIIEREVRMKATISELRYKLHSRIYEKRVARHQKLIEKWKPEVVNKITEEVNKKLQMQWENEYKKLQDDLYKSNQLLKKAKTDIETLKIKYEESQRVEDKLINKVETVSSSKGKIAEQKSNLSAELKETKEMLESKENNSEHVED